MESHGIKLGRIVNRDASTAIAVVSSVPPQVEDGFETEALPLPAEAVPIQRTPLVRTPLFAMACCSAIFLIGMFLYDANSSFDLRGASPELLDQYALYLTQKMGHEEAQHQRKNVHERLLKIAMAKETGDVEAVRRDLYELMLLDRDGQSPLYKQCSRWLQELPE